MDIKRENIFDNGFAYFKEHTNLTKAFPINEEMPSESYYIIWVKKGMINLLVDDILVSLDTNQMTFLTPSKKVKIIENHGQVKILQFNRAFYCIRENDHEVSCEGVLYRGALGVPIVEIQTPKQANSFERLLGILAEEFEIVDSIQEEMLRVILKKWLIKSVRIAKEQRKVVGHYKPRVELIQEFNVLLEKNYRTFHKVSDYAKLLNKSPKTLANQFKQLEERSPRELIQKRVILEAKRYLMHSSLRVKEISNELGFENASVFSNFFNNKTDLTPSKFREIYRK
ncbi:MAG: AraC family transcriptional activator of pobA [Flavobacteriales bacterium]|jgi:AraC family transcriptional activator of pobA